MHKSKLHKNNLNVLEQKFGLRQIKKKQKKKKMLLIRSFPLSQATFILFPYVILQITYRPARKTIRKSMFFINITSFF